jgi:outer membrane protein X
MKKILMIICLMLSSVSMFAEQGDAWVGVNVMNVGMNSNYVNLGFGAKIQYEPLKNIRGEASFNYFLKKDYHTMWDVNLNVHYLFHFGQLTVYPLVGGGLMDRTYEDTYVPYGIDESGQVKVINLGGDYLSDRYLGANAGAGVEYPVNDWLKVNAEVKVQFVQHHDVRPVASVGVSVKL